MTWVEDVLSALRIEVVKRERSRAWCLCPAHQKRDDPRSWATTFFVRLGGKRRGENGTQYDASGQFLCFSCGFRGPIRKLVMHVLGVDEEKARDFVRKRGGPRGSRVEELTKKVEVVRNESALYRPRFRMPIEVIFESLRSWVSPARDYAESRGLADADVEEFGIGYAVDGRKLGGRIVFPCRGAGGSPANYSARTFVDAEPRYTTPGPEEHADPSVFFGEHLWPAERELVVVTEGALNAVAVRRAMRVPVAAFGGSKNFELEHALKLATFRRVVLLTDPDAAGDAAARQIAMSLGRGVEALRVRLPDGKDAADVAPEKLKRVLEKAIAANRDRVAP